MFNRYTISVFTLLILSFCLGIQYVDSCKCIDPVGNVQNLICESNAFVKIKILGQPKASVNADGFEIKLIRARVEISIRGIYDEKDKITLITNADSAACGYNFIPGKSYYVAIYDDNHVNSCGVIEETDFPIVYASALPKNFCPTKPPCVTCEPKTCAKDCSTCAVSLDTCEECGIAVCCDYVKCAVQQCDRQSYLDRSRSCCPGECINVCEDVVCEGGQECVARQVLCLVPPCIPPYVGVCEDVLVCKQDGKLCCDGSVVERDPYNNCEFFPCPPECPPEGYCPQDDIKQCCDGTEYHRDPALNCEFPACPVDCYPSLCRQDAQLCCDGSSVERDPYNNCEFKPCPTDCPLGCPTADVQPCCDGSSFVGRDPNNNCEFFPCPKCETPVACTLDAKLCCDGTVVGRDFDNNCQWLPCPSKCRNKDNRVCSDDVKYCCDNLYVARNPEKSCNFDPCPPRCNSNKPNSDNNETE